MSYFKYFSLSYLFSSAFCMLLDFTVPGLRVKTNDKQKIKEDYLKILPVAFTNLILAWPVLDLSENYLRYQQRNNYPFFPNVLFWLLVADFIFYFAHRLLHFKSLYYFHSLHHEYDYSYGAGAFYAHPVDFMFANLLPIISPLLIFKPPDYFIHLVAIFATAYTVIVSHSSFKIFSFSHLNHHIYRTKNYGLFLTDKLLGTKK